MSRIKKNKKKEQSKIDKLLEIPKELSSDLPRITLIGFEELLIENYKSILEYQDFYIRLNTSIGIININGMSLNLKEMTSEDLMIMGEIESIDFETIIDEN